MNHQESSVTSARRYIEFLLKRKKSVELPDIPCQCIISYVPEVCDSLKALFPSRSLTLGITNPMKLDVFTTDQGRSFSVSHGMHGSPMAVVQLEELIALGCSNFLVIGPAGHPAANGKSELELGELLLATRAWIFEGTSRHYGKRKQSRPSSAALGTMRNTLRDLDLSYKEGAVATTDALYRETGPFLQKMLDRKVLAVEMELSALFTVAHFHGKAIAGLLFISDLVDIDGSWNIAPAPKVFRNTVRNLTDIVLAFTKQQ